MEEGNKHFESVELEEFDGDQTFTVKINDYVEVFMPDEKGLKSNGHFVWGVRLFKPRWFYSIFDTLVEGDDGDIPALKDEELFGFSRRELFDIESDVLETINGPTAVDCIYRTVNVVEVGGGIIPPALPEDAYFIRFSYNHKFNCIKDLHPLKYRTYLDEAKKVYRMLELYCGCGGLSFVGESSGDYRIEHCYAVDMDKDSLLTYKINHPHTNVFNRSVENFLTHCKGWLKVYEKYLPNAINCPKEEWQEDLEIECKICDLSAMDTDHPTVCIKDPSCRQGVRYHRIDNALEQNLITLQELQKYLWRVRRCRCVPLPSDVDIIAGGPPCQGLSSKNRSNDSSNIFSIDYNFQIKHFLRSVSFFKPNFIVLENIPEMFEAEEGLYVKFLVVNLITLGYQFRCGILSSACYGAPQIRLRCFVLGALSGHEKLPSLPHPTFNPPAEFEKRCKSINNSAKDCIVKIDPTLTSFLITHSVMGDITEDLPSVDNWSMIESTSYRLPPQRPYQHYLRRHNEEDPEFISKAQQCLLRMKKDVEWRVRKLLDTYESQDNVEDSELALGLSACAQNSVRDTLWQMHLASQTIEERKSLEEKREEVVSWIGQKIKCLAESFTCDYQGPCLNHRCESTNVGTYLRIKKIPPEGGDFTVLPGIVMYDDDYLCAGYVHGHRKSVGRKPQVTLACCPAFENSKHSYKLKDNRCSSYCAFVDSGDLAVEKWMILAWNRKRCPPAKVYGRMKSTEVVGTLLTALRNVCGHAALHPREDRSFSLREAARIQGFPDSYVFIGSDRNSYRPFSGMYSVKSRFKQLGNAVSPPVATMLGKALLRAIINPYNEDPPVVYIPNEELQHAVEKATKPPYIEEQLNATEEERTESTMTEDNPTEIDLLATTTECNEESDVPVQLSPQVDITQDLSQF